MIQLHMISHIAGLSIDPLYISLLGSRGLNFRPWTDTDNSITFLTIFRMNHVQGPAATDPNPHTG
jgi:hypothetical protein